MNRLAKAKASQPRGNLRVTSARLFLDSDRLPSIKTVLGCRLSRPARFTRATRPVHGRI